MPEPILKTFDALEMSRRLREQTGRELSSLTREQRLALLNDHIRLGGKALEPDVERALQEELDGFSARTHFGIADGA